MLARAHPGWMVRLLVAVVTLGVVFGSVAGSRAVAGAVTIECAPPASPAATTSVATPAAAMAPRAEFPKDGGNLTVFAAASLADAFVRIKDDLEAVNGGLSITYNFAGSQALVTQLTEGAPADVLAVAGGTQMTNAVDAGVIAGQPVLFAQNRLAIVVPKDNPAGVQSPADLAKSGLKLVLAQAAVPAGQYAREAICRAGLDVTAYGDGFVAATGANVVSEEDNVKAVLTKVRLGEADAGIVYVTDVTAAVADDVAVIPIPSEINVIATYPVAPVAGGNAALAAAFIAYLVGPAGQAALRAFGFEHLP